MSKIMMSLVLSSLLLLSACSEKKKETTKITKKEIEQKVLVNEKPKEILPHMEIKAPEEKLVPFVPTLETNITKEQVETENLEELELNTFKNMQPKINEEIQKIPDCLENAQTKEEAFACSDAFRTLNKEFSMSLGDLTEEIQEGYDDNFVWNEETKLEMIKEIEAGTQSMQEMQACTESAQTPQEIARCLKP
jgi:hypothetical protein